MIHAPGRLLASSNRRAASSACSLTKDNGQITAPSYRCPVTQTVLSLFDRLSQSKERDPISQIPGYDTCESLVDPQD